MRNTITSALLFCFLILCQGAFAQGISWISHSFIGPNMPANGMGVTLISSATDDQGNVYAAYPYLAGAVSFGGQLHTNQSQGVSSAIVKYSTNGAVAWVKQLVVDSGNFVQLAAVEVDGEGNLYAAGEFMNRFTVGTDTIVTTPFTTVNGNFDYFVAKWNPAGTLIWSAVGGGLGSKNIAGLALGPLGDVYVAGSFNSEAGPTNFGPFTLTSNVIDAFSNVVVLKYSSSGQLQWAQPFGHTVDDTQSYIRDIQVDQNNQVIIDGICTEPGYAGPSPSLFSFNGLNFTSGRFHIRMDSDGQGISYRQIHEKVGEYYQRCMVADAAGFTYITGAYTDTLVLGSTTMVTDSGTFGLYIAKYDPNGVLQWVKNGSAKSLLASYWSFDIALDEVDNLYVTGYYRDTVEFDGVQLPILPHSPNYLACLSTTTGTVKWVKTLANQYQGNIHTQVSTGANGHVTLAGGFIGGPLYVGSQLLNGGSPILTNQAFVSRVLVNYNTISGNVFVDQNLNGIKDSVENGHPDGSLVSVNPGVYAFQANAAGSFTVFSDSGSFAVSVANPPAHYNVVPVGPSTVSFNGFGHVAQGHDFALQPIPGQQDLEVWVTPIQPPRPGFTIPYRITSRNIGTVPVTVAEVSLATDPRFSLMSSTVPLASQAGSTFTWSQSNLQPAETRHITVYLKLDSTTALGETVACLAAIAPLSGDVNTLNNLESDSSTVIGAYDPNSIEVDFAQLSPLQVQNQQKLNYTIRFQNLGTDTAFTVMIRDSIPANLLQLGSIELLSTSHTCTWNLDAAGVLTVTFNNIRLPHEAIDTLGSNGFVRFRIKPSTTLAVGEIIPNQAHIYFDYNVPVSTNIAETEIMQQVTAAADLDITSWQLYPNPATNTVRVMGTFGRFAEVNLRLLNALGQEVYSRKVTGTEAGFEQEISLRNLPSGVYSVQLQTEEGSLVKRLVKQ